MGLFSKIKKGVKKAFKSIKKGFKKVFQKVGKFLGSDWGKAIMLGLTIVTAGTALAAGASAWSAAGNAGASFMGKFVAASKAFIGSLTGLGAEGAAGAATEAGAQTASATAKVAGAAEQIGQVNELAGAAGSIAKTGTDVIASAGGAANAAGAAQAVSTGAQLAAASAPAVTAAGTTAAAAAPAASSGMLSKAGSLLKSAGKGAMGFAKSAGGGALVGNVLQGYAAGQQEEEMYKRRLEEDRHYDRLWSETDLAERDIYDVATPQGYIDRARQLRERLTDEYRYPSSISAGT